MLNPTLPKEWLLLLAGGMWSAVGVMLSRFAVSWLIDPITFQTILLGCLGLLISIIANRFQFSKLAGKNIERISSLKEKACVFSFQTWKGYLIIAFMMTGGMLLRSSAIPKPYLAVVYAAIGGALLQASFKYYFHYAALHIKSDLAT